MSLCILSSAVALYSTFCLNHHQFQYFHYLLIFSSDNTSENILNASDSFCASPPYKQTLSILVCLTSAISSVEKNETSRFIYSCCVSARIDLHSLELLLPAEESWMFSWSLIVSWFNIDKMVYLSWQAETIKCHRKLKYLLSSECGWKAFTLHNVIDLNDITHHWLAELYIQQGILEVIYVMYPF